MESVCLELQNRPHLLQVNVILQTKEMNYSSGVG